VLNADPWVPGPVLPITHAWSWFQKAAGMDENAENIPIGKASGLDLGFTPVTGRGERLPADIRVISADHKAQASSIDRQGDCVPNAATNW
jgi:hypothetical protein